MASSRPFPAPRPYPPPDLPAGSHFPPQPQPPPPPPPPAHPQYPYGYQYPYRPQPAAVVQYQPPPPPPPSLYYDNGSNNNTTSAQYHPPPPPPPLPPSSPPPPPAAPPPPPPPPPEPSSHQQQSKPGPPPAAPSAEARVANGGRVETEEERRARKKREYERQRQTEKQRLQSKLSHPNALHKGGAPPQPSSAARPHPSMAGPRLAERRTAPLLAGDRVENRLKKPTTFLCKMKFRNELPDPTAQPKLLAMNSNKDRYTKYAITSLEKMHKPKLFVESDLGIPLDLLDLSVYNTPSIRPPLPPEDEELLRDGDVQTPFKKDGIRRKERPTDKGVAWLVKTQYISSLSMDSAKSSISEKQAKEMRESREGRNLFLEDLNNREKQIQAIEESFKAAKLPPVHQTNPHLEPVEVFPLFPDFDRFDDRFVTVTFDSDPTADSELYNKLDRSVRDVHESQAVMKSYVASGSDPTKPEKFLAYMVPAPDELSKDIYDENEDVSYSWVREYHWDLRGDDDPDNPTTYLVVFEDQSARYLPLATKLVLQKKKAKEGRSGDEVEHFPVPSRVTVRRRETVSVEELKDPGGTSSHHNGYSNARGDILNRKRRSSSEEAHEMRQKVPHRQNRDHSSEEEDLSD